MLLLGPGSGCIEPYHAPVGQARLGQFPNDHGNGRSFHDRVDARVYDLNTPRRGRVGRVLTTGEVDGVDLPEQAEIWRWSVEGVDGLRSGEIRQMDLSLSRPPRGLTKTQAHEDFRASTVGWSSWTCGRLFEFGERRWLEASQAKGIAVFRLSSEDYTGGPTHLLELRFDPDNREGRAPEAHFHLDGASLDVFLADAGITFAEMDRADAVVYVEKGRLDRVPDGHSVEAVPLVPYAIEGGDCASRYK